MPKIQPIASGQEFERALLVRPAGKGKPKKTALGKNLYLVTSLKPAPDGEVDLHYAFQLRIFGNGQDRTRTIGHHPAMAYSDARKKADEEWAEQKKAREEGREAERKRLYEIIRAGKMPTAPMPCFKNIDDAATFIERLKIAIDSRVLALLGINRLFPNLFIQPIQNEKIADTRLQVEIYLAIWLMLLIPSRINVLIDQIFENNSWSNQLLFQSSSKKHEQKDEISIELISNPACNAMQILRLLKNAAFTSSSLVYSASSMLASNTENHPLFPNLIKIKGNDRREKIAAAIKAIWPDHPIQINRFKAFFEEIAIRHSEFQTKFIKEYIANKRPNTLPSKEFFQLIALAEWWGWQLDMAQDIFKNHTFQSPQPPSPQGENSHPIISPLA